MFYSFQYKSLTRLLSDLFLDIWYFFGNICFDEITSRGREVKLLLGLLLHIIKEFSQVYQA